MKNSRSRSAQLRAAKFRGRVLPKLNRKGNGIREHRLSKDRLREAAVQMEIVALSEREMAKKEILEKAASRASIDREERREERRKARVAEEAADKIMAEIGPRIAELKEARPDKGLNLEEKIFILEAHFNRGIGAANIARRLSRAATTVTKFINQFRSTHVMAKLRLQAQADALAKRIIAKADVDQSMEVLDRLDVLPKKERSAKPETTQFNIVVGMPGQSTALPAPSQKVIDASK